MRSLSKKQKNIIKSYAKNGYFENDMLINKYGNKDVLLKVLEKANDYETLWSDLDMLINDLLFASTLEEKEKVIDNFR